MSQIRSVEFTENIDVNIAKYILENINKINYRIITDIDYNPVDKFKDYLKLAIKKNGIIKINYKSKNEERLYCSYGLQNMMREFRQSLCKYTHYDIDIKNCHPVLLVQYLEKNNIECKYLKKYVEEREKFFLKFESVGICKDDLKIEMLKIMNGGSLNVEKFKPLQQLYNELQTIQNDIAKLNEDILKSVIKDKNDKLKSLYNINGSVLNHLLQKLESKILNSAIDFMKKNGYNVEVPVFDGFMISKSKELNENTIKHLNDYVYKETNYKVEFLIKEMKEGLNYSLDDIKHLNDNNIIIDNDEDGAKIILKLLNNKIIKSQKRIFIRKFENSNIYDEDLSMHFRDTKNELKKFIINLSICKIDDKGNIKCISKMLNGCETLAETVFILLDDDENFIDNLWKSNLEKLCFLDGYYDFKTKQFKPYDNETYTITYIKRSCNFNISEVKYNELINKIINPILYNKKDQKEFLNWCSRGLAGCYTDKTWSLGLGFRNSGKGVLNELFCNTFNNYVGQFNANELLCSRIGNQEISKKLAWSIPFQFRRLNFSNEIKNTDENGHKLKIDGNLIKALSSGGDELRARCNYKDEIKFKVQGRMCLFMNDIIESDPNDATETLSIFKFMSIFKDEITENEKKINDDEECETKYFLKDEKIKTELLNDVEIQNAFIKLIIDSYTDKPLYSNLKKSKDDMYDDDNDEDNIISKHFNITLNKDDLIIVKDFNDYAKENINLTKAKLKFIISKLGVKEYRKEDFRYYRGIKFI
jgi:hypothetical protein